MSKARAEADMEAMARRALAHASALTSPASRDFGFSPGDRIISPPLAVLRPSSRSTKSRTMWSRPPALWRFLVMRNDDLVGAVDIFATGQPPVAHHGSRVQRLSEQLRIAIAKANGRLDRLRLIEPPHSAPGFWLVGSGRVLVGAKSVLLEVFLGDARDSARPPPQLKEGSDDL